MENYRYFDIFSSDDEIFKKIENEKEYIGYYKLPSADIEYLKELDKFKQKNIVVVGIGGSSLGTYAIYKFLNQKSQKKLHFLESTDPISLKSKIESFDIEDALFIVISKSGTTIETISIFKYLQTLLKITGENCVAVTEGDSPLSAFAYSRGILRYEIPKNVGGRFSVLSNVGLVPLYLMGIDITKLLEGADCIRKSFFSKDLYYDILINKARFISENKDKYNINALFSYSEVLEGFNRWYIQLWGESLGKIDAKRVNKGLTPIGLLGPIDQHSFLQLIAEGRRDKTLTFIKIKDFKSDLKISHESLAHLESLDVINGLDFATLINLQADATIESVKNLKDIPVDVIEINDTTEFEIGKLMFYYMLLTSLVAKFIGIDAYGQPGVELGKEILKKKLENLK